METETNKNSLLSYITIRLLKGLQNSFTSVPCYFGTLIITSIETVSTTSLHFCPRDKMTVS